ncbi:MAG: DJ-1/PfpI family protein [bacterium]|nr:DJ-1/PfpI family protein [bacterium]
MKGVILLDNYFEDTEALSTIDVIKRGGIDILKVNMSNNEILETQYGHKLIVKDFYHDINFNDYDFLVIPGGRAVMNSLFNDERVYKTIKEFDSKHKLIACICAAPSLLREQLKNKEFSCYPGIDKYIDGKYNENGVTRTDNYITARSMYFSIEFGLEIVKYLTNNTNLRSSLEAK